MNRRLRALLTRWGLQEWERDTETLLDLSAIQYLGRRLWDDYEPAQFDRFENRLDRWLHNVTEETDKLILFRLLERLFFIGRAEFESLCRAAFHGPVTRWLIEQVDIQIGSIEAAGELASAVNATWFCPITDSMRINAFLKVNRLTGKSHRPDWRSLKRFGEREKILSYMASEGLSRLVLLEDFVGSGTQMKSAIKFAASLSADLEILACPLVVCPAGDEVGLSLMAELPNISYEAAMRIAPGMLIPPEALVGERPFHAQVRDLITRVSEKLGPTEGDALSRRHHGYKGTGATVALYSNCPNNTLPIIWDETPEWKPLFPRLSRV